MSNKIITVDEVLNTNKYIKEGSAIDFRHPKEYFGPFLDDVSKLTTDFKVQTSGIVANEREDGERQESYSRILIQANLPKSYDLFDHCTTIGMVYALDTLKPIMKVYTGNEAYACTNLAIFNASYVHEVELIRGTDSVYSKLTEFRERINEVVENFRINYGELYERQLSEVEVEKLIGRLLIESINNKQVGSTAVVQATRDIYEPKARYAFKDKTSAWNIYSALTQYITDKVDIADKASKTVITTQLFKQCLN